MNVESNNLWSQFLQELSSVGIVISPENFKLASGLKIADWQLVDYTGLNEDYKGQIDVQNLYSTADPMSNLNDFIYQPTNSFYDQYSAFVNSIQQREPLDQTLVSARTNLNKYTMGPDNAPFPCYLISPDLNEFFKASLLGVSNPPKLQFSTSFKRGKSKSKSLSRSKENEAIELPHFVKVKSVGVSNRLKSTRNIPELQKKSTNKENNYQYYTFDFTVQNAQIFTISPSRWLNTAMISNYYDKIDPASALFGKTLFGENGVLNNRVVSVLVVFKRKVVITANFDELMNLHDPDYMTGSDASVDIGGFTFGGVGTHFSSDKNSNSYTYQDSGNAPYIIGYSIQKLGPSK